MNWGILPFQFCESASQIIVPFRLFIVTLFKIYQLLVGIYFIVPANDKRGLAMINPFRLKNRKFLRRIKSSINDIVSPRRSTNPKNSIN